MISRATEKEQTLIAYSLWATLGTFGCHRFYTGRTRTGVALLAISVLQCLIIVVTFARPLTPPLTYCFWPPFAAYINMTALVEILRSSAPYTGDGGEVALIRPLLWVLTLPSLFATVWALADGALLARWVRNRRGRIAAP